MAYGHSIKKRSNKSLEGKSGASGACHNTRSFAKTRKRGSRWLFASLAMAAGIFAYPFVVEATTITPKDANDASKIQRTGNVYNIDPQKSSGNFAYNRFSAFSLDAGNIANLKFGSADLLANLVNSKININGIVNGIKDGKINGHLMFLSPEGIAVGKFGVINAGQFTGIVPTKTAFDTLYNAANITLDAVNALKAGSYANDKSIDVEGKINTHSGAMLGAGVINIKDVAVLQSTKSLDFKDLVSTGSGLGELTAVAGTGGDIILTARQTSEVKDTNPIRWNERSTDLSAAVNIGKNVSVSSSDGAVMLTAESTSKFEDSTPMTLTNTLKDAIFGSEKTAIDGLIDKLAKKEAGANKYLFFNYSSKKNKSSINIGENSAITGNNIEIAATSTVEINQSVPGLAGTGKKDSNGQQVQDGSKAIAAVAVSRVYNNADVVIDGNLQATGADANGSGVMIAANADTKAALSATGNGGDGNAVAAGVAVLTGDTKSKVTVNAPTNATALNAANGKASVEAVTKSDVDITVNAVGDTSYVVSNVGVANYDTGADVIINRSINAGAVDVKAENNITGLKITVDNTVSSSGSGNAKDTAAASDEQKKKDDAAANAEKSKSKSED